MTTYPLCSYSGFPLKVQNGCPTIRQYVFFWARRWRWKREGEVGEEAVSLIFARKESFPKGPQHFPAYI